MVLAAADQVGIDRGPLRAKSGSDALDKWSDLIDELRDRIPWDDRDYPAGDAFLDLDPAVGDALKEQLGIEDDDYSVAPVEPTPAGLALPYPLLKVPRAEAKKALLNAS